MCKNILKDEASANPTPITLPPRPLRVRGKESSKSTEPLSQFRYLISLPGASEQGNVIGSVRIYIYVCVQNKIVIERTRDLIYLKFVATDFFPKIISLSAGENSGDLA